MVIPGRWERDHELVVRYRKISLFCPEGGHGEWASPGAPLTTESVWKLGRSPPETIVLTWPPQIGNSAFESDRLAGALFVGAAPERPAGTRSCPCSRRSRSHPPRASRPYPVARPTGPIAGRWCAPVSGSGAMPRRRHRGSRRRRRAWRDTACRYQLRFLRPRAQAHPDRGAACRRLKQRSAAP